MNRRLAPLSVASLRLSARVMLLGGGLACTHSAPARSIPDPPPRPVSAQGLRAGMRLHYAGNDQPQPPWTIDSVTHAVAFAGRNGCSRVVLRTRPDQSQREVRLMCEGGDTLFTWSAATSTWRAQRMLGTRQSLSIRTADGGAQEVITNDETTVTVGRHVLRVVATTLLTKAPDGRPTRRLTELYAPALGTAVEGAFAVPDSATAGSWRVVQRFRLLSIETP